MQEKNDILSYIKNLIINQELDKTEIYQEIFGETVAYDTARKQLKGIENFINLVEDGCEFSDSKIEQKIRELQVERIKLQTEKSEYNRQLREQTRADMTEEKIVAAIRDISKNIKVEKIKPITPKKNDVAMVLGKADMHYGAEFKILDLVGNILNEYSPEIFEDRMWKVLSELVNYAEKNNINEVTIFNLGDDIEGILHISQLLILRYGMIDSVIHLAAFLTKWILTLATHMRVNYKIVRGNHSDARILTGKKGDFPHENLSKIIVWHLQTLVREKDVPNVTVQGYNEEGNVYCNINGFDILAVHGHNESSNLAKSLKDYIMLYSKNNIDYLFAGHLHSGLSEEVCKNKEVIRFPSIMGGNDYSVFHKKISNAGAKILLFEKNIGITDEHRIILK